MTTVTVRRRRTGHEPLAARQILSDEKSIITEMFPAELREKHLVNDALYLVESAPWLQAALHHHGLGYR